MQVFYVYELWDPIKTEPFYVGKGKERPGCVRYEDHLKKALGIKNFRDQNYHKLNRIKKIVREGSQPEVKIIIKTEDETTVFNKEIELIKFYGRRDKNTGSLTNMTDGGEGASGRVFSEEEKRKIGLRVKGKGNPMYGKKHAPKALRMMSDAAKIRTPTPHTEEWKQHLREDNAGGKATAIPIYQINFKGDIIKKWPSARAAAYSLGFSTYRNIYSCARNNQRLKPRAAKGINQYSLSGVFIKSWESQLQIKRELNLNNSTISNIIKEKRQPEYGGFRWALESIQ